MDEDTRTLPLDAPLLLGRYRLGPVIGRGGMSTVYRGEDTQLGRPVAIKILAAHLSSDPQFRRRLLAEAQAAASLPHPHIVRVFDVGTSNAPDDGSQTADTAEDGSVVLVMELVDGETLRHRLDAGPLPVDDAAEITAQVADALAFAHSRGIVHRDVKPHNILLVGAPPDGGKAGGVAVWSKLADFGIARAVDATSTQTATGLVLGSAPYLAPELLDGITAGPDADLYALGVTLFQALTGRLPFQGGTASAALAQRLTVEAPRVRSIRPDVPDWLDGLVARALARQPHDRFAGAASFARALRDPHGATTQLLSRPRVQSPSGQAPDESQTTGLWRGATPAVPPARATAAAAPRRKAGGTLPSRALLGFGALALIAVVAIAASVANTRQGGPSPLPTSPLGTPAAGPTTAPAADAEMPTPTAIVIRPR